MYVGAGQKRIIIITRRAVPHHYWNAAAARRRNKDWQQQQQQAASPGDFTTQYKSMATVSAEMKWYWSDCAVNTMILTVTMVMMMFVLCDIRELLDRSWGEVSPWGLIGGQGFCACMKVDGWVGGWVYRYSCHCIHFCLNSKRIECKFPRHVFWRPLAGLTVMTSDFYSSTYRQHMTMTDFWFRMGNSQFVLTPLLLPLMSVLSGVYANVE